MTLRDEAIGCALIGGACAVLSSASWAFLVVILSKVCR